MKDLIAATSLVILLKLRSNRFLARMTLKLDGQPKKTIGHLFYATSRFVHYLEAISEFKWSYSTELRNSGKNWQCFAA